MAKVFYTADTVKALTPAQVAELLNAKAQANKVTVKVSEKGCISVYGLQRFPVSLYAPQWLRVFEEAAPAIHAVIKANPALLERKD